MTNVNRSTFLKVVACSLLTATFAWTQPAQAADPVVVLKTSLGAITIQLDPTHAPDTTANFLAYVDNKFYDGTIFHRVIPGFVAQGGGFTPDMTEKPTKPPVHNESSNGLRNWRGTISMARTPDPDSATSQFFLNLGNNTSLDPTMDGPGYAVFGKIIGGLDVLDKIAQVPTTTKGPYGDVPVDPVIIISATRQK
jgi:peptidyl-prolyl cis-trans isomerase A (cyclophilin A)